MLKMNVIDLYCNNATLAFDYSDSVHFKLGMFAFLTLHSCNIKTPQLAPDATPLDLANLPDPRSTAGTTGAMQVTDIGYRVGYRVQAAEIKTPTVFRALGGSVYRSCEVRAPHSFVFFCLQLDPYDST